MIILCYWLTFIRLSKLWDLFDPSAYLKSVFLTLNLKPKVTSDLSLSFLYQCLCKSLELLPSNEVRTCFFYLFLLHYFLHKISLVFLILTWDILEGELSNLSEVTVDYFPGKEKT